MNRIRGVPILLAIITTFIYFIQFVASWYESPDVEHLARWGANLPSLTLNGQSWRMLVSMFLHGGWMHLLINMYFLIRLGMVMEVELGSPRFCVIYLLSGLSGSLVSAWWAVYKFMESGAEAVSVGASGAIMGLAGAKLAFEWVRLQQRTHPPSVAMDDVDADPTAIANVGPILILIVFNVFAGLIDDEVDQACHLGGLLAGGIVGLIFSWGLTAGKGAQRFVGPSAVCAAGCVVIFSLTWFGGSQEANAFLKDLDVTARREAFLNALKPEVRINAMRLMSERYPTVSFDNDGEEYDRRIREVIPLAEEQYQEHMRDMRRYYGR